MEHLRAKFRLALADESNTYTDKGQIFIREHRWTPDDALERLLTPEAFEQSFGLWIEERKAELIATADGMLKTYGLEDRFRSLEQAFARNQVTPFVGAGMSMSSDYPGWTAFLLQIRAQTDLSEPDLQAMLNAGHYEEAAEELSRRLGPAFNEAVQNAFGVSRELRGAVQCLPYLFDSSVITTNFDDVLKRCFDNAVCSFADQIAGADAAELDRRIASGEKLLVKLHGLATTGRGRVLTKSEYDRHYAVPGDARRVIEAMFRRTLLFMGCRLTIDRTLNVMKEVVTARGHDNVPRHYALLADPGDDSSRNTRRDELVECNIYPIWYPPKTDDDSIEAYLIKLAGSVE